MMDLSLFDSKLVFFDNKAKNSSELFDELNRYLYPEGYVRDSWLMAIKKREDTYPTGLESPDISFAIPHVEPEHIVKPYIAVIKPAEPITFQPMGGVVNHPVEARLIINLGLIEHDEEQVATLQALMGLFMDNDAVNDILSQETGEGIVSAIKMHLTEQ
ncbi:PTS sugar transporter subunit IIA [Alkalibaculum bacchi]|jgi:PTS system galactitol-specific IIA component|uniref:PTS sugar transporter subunit IIA n=1 Tax=Alkalibaculum bacchi TaxID=645887 RepID=UPI0026F009D1|nr:PTS sugar transporter subunit IIA [Alkalibaculum bacchi]MCI1934028.1 PTS sugar transporter subunit IIA [Atopobiaceae bacterium]